MRLNEKFLIQRKKRNFCGHGISNFLTSVVFFCGFFFNCLINLGFLPLFGFACSFVCSLAYERDTGCKSFLEDMFENEDRLVGQNWTSHEVQWTDIVSFL